MRPISSAAAAPSPAASTNAHAVAADGVKQQEHQLHNPAAGTGANKDQVAAAASAAVTDCDEAVPLARLQRIEQLVKALGDVGEYC